MKSSRGWTGYWGLKTGSDDVGVTVEVDRLTYGRKIVSTDREAGGPFLTVRRSGGRGKDRPPLLFEVTDLD